LSDDDDVDSFYHKNWLLTCFIIKLTVAEKLLLSCQA
jgi:hypothetical protein